MSLLLHIYTLSTAISPGNLPEPSADSGTLTSIINIALNIIGALALLMMTVSGLRYIISAGDAQKTSSAKNGIIYAFVGLMVAIAARAIVAFVAVRL
jgi:type IV secretion system pilin